MKSRGRKGPVLRIVEPGLLATLQDLGRPGSASLGVAPSGALDRGSARTANRLVGNPEDAAVIEATMGGLRAVASRDLWFAVTGAWGPIRLAGHEVDPYEAHEWPTGSRAAHRLVRARRARLPGRAGRVRRRSRARLALHGRARGHRPAALCGPATSSPSAPIRAARSRSRWWRRGARRTTTSSRWSSPPARGRTGSRHPPMRHCSSRCGRSRTTPTAWACGWTDRRSSARPRRRAAERGHGARRAAGSAQRAADDPAGRRPVTGGYPVIAVATDAALDLLAQARPGTRMRFRHARVT